MSTGTSFRILAFSLLCTLLLSRDTGGYPGLRVCSVSITSIDNKAINLTVEIADNDADRSLGLMYRKRLDKFRGMIFMYRGEDYLNFWMKNTYVPLSIAYIGSNMVINEIYDMKPLDTSVTYPSKFPAQFALEVNQGWFREHRITAGSKINIHGCFGK